MLYPEATFRPVANIGGRLINSKVLGLVVHVQEGDNSLFGLFNDPASQVSSHFWISKTGTVEQYVDTDNQAWAQAAGNASYLSVETEGFDTEPLTPSQLDELANLWLWVRTVFLLPDELVDHGGRGLTTHAHFPSGLPDPAWGNHTCPGAIRAGQLPSIVATPTPPVEVPKVGVYLYAPTTAGDPAFVTVDGVVMSIVDTVVVAKYTVDKVGGCVVLPADHAMCMSLKAKAGAPA